MQMRHFRLIFNHYERIYSILTLSGGLVIEKKGSHIVWYNGLPVQNCKQFITDKKRLGLLSSGLKHDDDSKSAK